jgi:hypothetical protein
MTISIPKKFFLTLRRRDGEIVGHNVSRRAPSFPAEREPDDGPPNEEESPKEDSSPQKPSGSDFETVFKNFVSTI